MFRKIQHIHLVGIGGAGMSGIAEVLLTLGYEVTGSDLSESETTRRLQELGGRIFIGHQESNVGDAQVVVISSAVAATNPEVVVARTNLVQEHLDHYGTMERLQDSFLEFINRVPFYGLAVLCADDDRIRTLLPRVVKRYQTYGLREQAGAPPPAFRAAEIALKQWGAEFRAYFRGKSLGPFRLSTPGIHNVTNALAAIAVGTELDVPVDLIRKGLAAFTGVERRFHLRGEKNGIMIVDDYGHHPTEIRATLSAAKQGWDRRLVVLFQPHRYTRTRDLVSEFAHAFDQAEVVVITELYPAGE